MHARVRFAFHRRSLSAGATCAVLLAAMLCGCGKEREPAVDGGADPDRGRRLLAQFQCGSCHAIPGVEAARGTAGPPLATFGRQSYIAGTLPNDPAPLARWIVDPPAVKPGTAMPALGVSPDDARHMAAYLHTLR
ncbi:c-type cytochrome [Pseudoduganella chitinolytica]|uniref:C-type cytochrome n=1 Tax=Pseudoduganella chitinolytica TaxID=34070 RepID=A0ABY8BHN2_9BURK|nr:c-type cytochrome [Pseudoduganella chitinolytica]WEF34431.1 c-type cytochrome [Pseudoduganella chitinolytica]